MCIIYNLFFTTYYTTVLFTYLCDVFNCLKKNYQNAYKRRLRGEQLWRSLKIVRGETIGVTADKHLV